MDELLPGRVIAERFEIERRAGAGGMATVYRARDRETGEPCALKVLGRTDARNPERFDREARVLADLRHPAIVRYLHHGITGDGDRYLAMEWLDGEDLAARLARAPLSVSEVLTVARVVGEALAVAHGRGVVHRDVKPSNLYLVGGRIDRVKVLDFGIARILDEPGQPTRTGVRVGTPSYMSPEQARGATSVDSRTDVFSLGCVLYEGLAGGKPFGGGDAMAVLAKILLDEPPPIGEVRDHVPPAVAELIADMMTKDPEDRLRDGAAVAAEAARIAAALPPARGPGGRSRTARETASPLALTVGERRLLAVVSSQPPDALGCAPALRHALAGISGPADPEPPGLELLHDGTVLVVVTGTGAATDLAARAARVALAVRAATGSGVAVATGRAMMTGVIPVGEVIDRAAALLRALGGVVATADTLELPRTAPLRPVVRVDEVTAALLDARFEVSGDADGLVLIGERATADATRTLLGRPTPCVGREPELAALEASFAACAAGEARAVLVTAPAGVGKSRLRYELVRRLAQSSSPPEIWMARGDALGARTPFGLLGGALRRVAGILDGEPLEVRQRKLRARVARHVPAADVSRVAEFLGELIGAPFAGAGSVQLRAARTDAMLMGDQMRRAWEEFLAAECGERPVVLVLEDMQWGDTPTVTFVDGALDRLRDLPFMVLGLGRPEVHDLFPRLWAERGVQVLRLGDLPRRAAQRLAREVLGDDADPQAVTRLVERAGGNAFYLEELLRAVVEGRGELPESVLTMVQARLEGMEAEARRVLRAASVFGQVFWTGGVVALLGGETRAGVVDDWLGELAAREVVTARSGGRFPGQAEYVFRHALVREAAYAMLVDADRSLGHRLAGAWLEKVGEPSATTLAEHFERGGAPREAIGWWRRAGEQALGGNDLPAVLTACRRGVACGATGETLGALRVLAGEAHLWRAEFEAARASADEAMTCLARGGDPWYAALTQAATAAYSLGDRERLLACVVALGDPSDLGTARPVRVIAAARMVPQLLFNGLTRQADALWAALVAVGTPDGDADPALAAEILNARASKSLFDGDIAEMLDLTRQTVEMCERSGDLRSAQTHRGSIGYGCLELGDHGEAVRELREALDAAHRQGLHELAAAARQNLGLALVHVGALDEAAAEENLAIREFEASGNRRMEAASRYYLGYIRMMAGDLAGAAAITRGAVEMAAGPPMIRPVRAEGLGILAAILLGQRQAAEALAAAGEAMRLLDEMGGIDGGESVIRLAYAEALHATGAVDQARAAIAAARDRLLERADRMSQSVLRSRFLDAVPENARTLRLASEWLAPTADGADPT